jgi:hypothetical protein
MLDVLKTVNKILRVVFIGFIAITAIAKVFDIKKPADKITASGDEDEYNTSEFDEIW